MRALAGVSFPFALSLSKGARHKRCACGEPPFDRLRANGEGLSAPHHLRNDAAAE